MPLGAIASIIGIASGAKNLLSRGQQGGSKSGSTYVPTGLGAADTTFQNLLSQGGEQVGQAQQFLNPQLMAALSQYLGIPTGGLTAGANLAGQLYQGQINPALSAQGNLTQNALNVQGAGNQLYQTAFDPQQALFNRYLQQVQDISNAGSSMRGIGTGGVAQGIENQATNNFLQDWQNQQVGREYQGLQGLAGAYNQAGRNYSGALAAGALAPGYAQAAGSVPYGAQVQAASQPFNAAQAYYGATSPGLAQAGGLMAQIIPYLNQGLGATNQAFGQQQAGLGNLAVGLGYLGSPQGKNALQALGNIFSQPQGQGYGYAGSADPSAGGTFESGPW